MIKMQFLGAVSASLLSLCAGTASVATYDVTEALGFTGSIVTWTAPEDGDYWVVAVGAQSASGDVNYLGGRGAQIEGTFNLSAGDVFQILVGGMGLGQSSGAAGGGGGGTRTSVTQNGTDASIAEAAFTASQNGMSYSPVLKAASTVGQGGIISHPSFGSAGAGFYSDGAAEYLNLGGGPARSWANGMLGGIGAFSSLHDGGFGGGGSGQGHWGGGGGGGYSGGDGGRVAGGGSFNAGFDGFALAGVGYGNGSLTISYDSIAAVPLPAAAWMMLAALLSLVGLRRRAA